MGADKEVLIRTAVLVAALINQILVLSGKNTLPFSEEEITRGLTAVFTAAASLWAWWKNNSFTEAARKGDEAAAEVRRAGKREEGEL